MNNKIKKIFSVFLCAVMVLATFAVTVSAVDGDSPVFSVAVSDEIAVNNEISVLLSVENISEFTEANVEITYDSTSLYFIEIKDPIDYEYSMG